MRKTVKRIFALMLAVTTAIVLVPPVSAVKEAESGDNAGALRLIAAEDVTVHLYKEFDSAKEEVVAVVEKQTAEKQSETKIEQDTKKTQKTEEETIPAEEEVVRIYTYENLPVGCYTYVASGEGYYTVRTNLYFSETDAAQGRSVEINLGKKAGTGYEPDTVKCLTSETVEKNFGVDGETWAGYENVLTTPAFSQDKADHAFTSQEEMEEFISALDKTDDNMYVYSLGNSAEGRSLPIVVFTKLNLSAAATLEQAAELIGADEKPVVHYQAQIHGNEPAAGEGALAIMAAMQDSLGTEVLENINLYIIPRVNPDGSAAFTRGNSIGLDMNRDHMRLVSQEVQLIHYAYNLFQPEVTIDGHEFDGDFSATTGALTDVMLGVAGGMNLPAALTARAKAIRDGMLEAGEAKNLRMSVYGDYESSANYTTGRGYYGLQGSLSFLVETRGIDMGKTAFSRRVLSQYLMVESILTQVADTAETVMETVKNAREQISTMSTRKMNLVLSNTSSETEGITVTTPVFDRCTGEQTEEKTKQFCDLDTAARTRSCPTAYVIPKDAAYAQQAVEILTANGATYYEIAAGAKAYLQQYSGTATEATVGEETLVSLPFGAYVFPMNQQAALVIAMTLEPDVTDIRGESGTTAQTGLVDVGQGMTLYRCVRKLDENGCIPLAGSYAWVIWPVIGFAAALVVLAFAVVVAKKKKTQEPL